MKLKNRKNKSIFRKFSKKEHEVWGILSERRLKSLKDNAHPMHKKGWRVLNLNTKRIPDFREINKKLKKLTGWQVASTGVQYEEDGPWISSLAEKKIRVTEYIRDKKDLDYTPLPDVFHDAFGHLPFLADAQYARIAHKFGLAYIQAETKEDKLKIANNWWYGIEFSFIKVRGKVKALGTGLISSEGELKNALSDKVEKLPYDAEMVGKIDRSAHKFHDKLFMLESLNQLEDIVDSWLK
ncbi:MAG: hypothetical protein WAV15_03935 [Minisyncoccia bacterium]